MLEKIPDGLHFDILTLSPTRVNWVERWSKVRIILFIGPTMWVYLLGMERHNLGLAQWSLGLFNNGLGQIKDP